MEDSRTTDRAMGADPQDVHGARALRRINRALCVLSAAGSALVRATDEPDLLQAICRASVDLGGYLAAWVGYAEDDDGRTVRPVASAGVEAAALDALRVTWAEDAFGRGPTGLAVRTGMPQVNRDFASNADVLPWREEARQRGYRSSIAVPLSDGGRPFGALIVYAKEQDAFDDHEVALFSRLADDLAFGVTTLRSRAAHRRVEAQVARLAYFDALTGLPNRAQLLDRLAEDTGAEGADASPRVLLTLDIDAFTDIQFGVGVGQADELLQQVAARIRSALPDDALLARTGDDRFCVLVRGGQAMAIACAARVERSLATAFVQAGMSLDVRMNMGVAIAPDHGTHGEALLLRSTMAARQAKHGGAGLVVYAAHQDEDAARQLSLISELRDAINERSLVLQYQPKIHIGSGRVMGVEALVRWRHPTRGLIPPGEFIPMAERTGLIRPLTWIVLNAAILQCSLWRHRGLELPVAVNVCARNLDDPEFLARVTELLQRWQVPPGLLQLEITESVLMNEPAATHDLLGRLQDAGISVSIDDFGTGYSSLSYIATLPIQALKIDRSFISRMLDSPRVHTVVKATISMAAALGIKTVAEGVENRAQALELLAMGCDECQGFLFGHPMDPHDLSGWLKALAHSDHGAGLRPGPA